MSREQIEQVRKVFPQVAEVMAAAEAAAEIAERSVAALIIVANDPAVFMPASTRALVLSVLERHSEVKRGQ